MYRPSSATLLIAGLLAGTARAHWVTTPDVSDLPLGGVDILDAARVRVCGDGGRIFVSKDAGLTWSAQRTGVDAGLLTISFASPALGWAGGRGGVVVGTADGGQTWGKQAVIDDDFGLGAPDAVFRVAAAGDNTAWALVKWGEVSVLRRTVGGGPWTGVEYTDHSYRAPNTLYDLAMFSETEGWLVASRINESNRFVPVLMHTTDAGVSWEALDVPAPAFATVGSPRWKALVSAPVANLAWLHIADAGSGLGGLFRLRRASGGWEWAAVSAPAGVAALCFLDDTRGYLVGERTWATRDAGASFRCTANPGFAAMTSADFLPTGAGAAVDAFGRVHTWRPDRLGDVNGDGFVTLTDAILLVKALESGAALDPWSVALADLNADGGVTFADVADVLSVVGGLSANVTVG
jgi:photosystem II stability/assembly factor-like uncharacterized protein